MVSRKTRFELIHFKTIHKRDSKGRFIVRVPFQNDVQLSESKSVAERKLSSLENEFKLVLNYKQNVYSDYNNCLAN